MRFTVLSAEGWSINDDTGMVTPSAAASQLKKDNIVAGVNQSKEPVSDVDVCSDLIVFSVNLNIT